jgi:hypothetical protein
VRGLIAALNKEDGRSEAGEPVRALLDRIVLTPADGELEVDLVGDLAGIIVLALGLHPEMGALGLANPETLHLEEVPNAEYAKRL